MPKIKTGILAFFKPEETVVHISVVGYCKHTVAWTWQESHAVVELKHSIDENWR